MTQTIHLYAIRLDDVVLQKPRFIERNPDYMEGKPCYYIGTSIYDPDTRFRMHKEGHKSSKWVRDHGLYVARRRCKVIQVSNGEERAKAEAGYAALLRKRGYGIWQN